MPRNKLLILCALFILSLASAMLIHAQTLPDAFSPVLHDISAREGRTVTAAQLLDYSYSDVLDDFQKDCGSGTSQPSHYTIVTVMTDQLVRYIYHVKADHTTAVLCSLQHVPPTATPTVDLLRTTATPSLVPTATETPRVGAMHCDGFLYSRLRAGEQGRVLPGGTPNRLHLHPTFDLPELGLIPPGETFDILDGPTCDANGYAWWLVRYLKTEGWIVEGEGQDYYVEPIIVSALFPTNTPTQTPYPTSTPRPTSCPASPPFRLKLTSWARVTPGDPNNLRNDPTTSSYVIMIIPAGERVRIVDGPRCDEKGRTWWAVLYQNTYGWTIEGEGSAYYLEPSS